MGKHGDFTRNTSTKKGISKGIPTKGPFTTMVALKKALKEANEKASRPYLLIFPLQREGEAFSFVTVPREPWAPKRESPIVSLFGAHGSLLRQP